MQAIYVYNLIPSLLLNDGYISKANPFFSETVTITNGNKYLRKLSKTTKLNFICFCVYVHVDCDNYFFLSLSWHIVEQQDVTIIIYNVKSSLIPLAVRHKFSVHRALHFHWTGACQLAKHGNLRQQLHTEEVDHPFLWNLEAGLFVVGCPAPLEWQFGLQRMLHLLAFEQEHH